MNIDPFGFRYPNSFKSIPVRIFYRFGFFGLRVRVSGKLPSPTVSTVYTSLSVRLSSSSSWYAPMGATTLYVVLMLMSCTNIRIYKEEEPPLPARRADYSVILMVSMFYFTYHLLGQNALIYIFSLFAFGISIFQLNSPMDTETRLLHLLLWFNLHLSMAYGLEDYLESNRTFWWVCVCFPSHKAYVPS